VNSVNHAPVAIELTQGIFTIVDREWYEMLNSVYWRAHFSKSDGKYRAITSIPGEPGKSLLMHRLILDVTDINIDVDHINRNPLDNRGINLRIATRSQNMRNQPQRRGTSSKYKGVSLLKGTKWRARAKDKNGKELHIGTFLKEVDAAIAYNKYVKDNFGEFAYLNIIE